VFVTSLPTIAAMVGANRIVRGQAITAPFGDPTLPPVAELALRRKLVERALEMLETDVGPTTIWS
jgi:glycine reductase